ncbi:MAG: hypothetical protein JWP07_1357 [Pseudonocardiales bacterium]|jgi:hypothetical protein|nr:hypothetical protein [Pseudonocardiales bacterium]
MSWPLVLIGVLAAAGCSGHATSSASRDSLSRDTSSSQSNYQHFRLAPPGQSAAVMTACLHRGGVQVDPVPAALVGRMSIVTVSMGTHGGSQISFFATPNVAKRFVTASGSFPVHRVGAVTFDLTGIPRVDRVIGRCAANLSGRLS